MKNKKVVLLILVVLIPLLFFFLWKRRIIFYQISQLPGISDLTKNNQSLWLTYRDPESNYTIRYPFGMFPAQRTCDDFVYPYIYKQLMTLEHAKYGGDDIPMLIMSEDLKVNICPIANAEHLSLAEVVQSRTHGNWIAEQITIDQMPAIKVIANVENKRIYFVSADEVVWRITVTDLYSHHFALAEKMVLSFHLLQ